MVDPWDAWDDRLIQRGGPERLAQDLTDEELLNLLASEAGHGRRAQKSILKQEALDRLHRAQRSDRGQVGEPGEYRVG